MRDVKLEGAVGALSSALPLAPQPAGQLPRCFHLGSRERLWQGGACQITRKLLSSARQGGSDTRGPKALVHTGGGMEEGE